MLKSIFEVAISALIIVGTLAVVYIAYTTLHGAIYDPSLPHDALWKMLFGSSN